jgi:hypothetical protein
MLLSPAIHSSAKAWVSAKVFNRLLNEAVEAQLYQVRPSTTGVQRLFKYLPELHHTQRPAALSTRVPRLP